MADLDRLDALARAYDAAVHKIRQDLTAFASQMWASMPDYRDEAVETMARALAPRVLAGQLQTAELTRAYLIGCASELGLTVTAPAIDREAVIGMRGVDPLKVYQRPGMTTWTALSRGKTLEQAVSAGGLRLTQLIGGDLQNAKRVQSRDTMRATGGRYYRRILTGRENCALCVIASTQRYHVENLLPIHPGCDCNVGPLPAGMAVDQVIDAETLEAAHKAVEARTGASDRGGRLPEYKDIILTTEHGEYGPVISFKETRQDRRKATRTKEPDKALGRAREPKMSGPTPAATRRNRPPEIQAERLRRQRRLRSDLSDLAPAPGLTQEVLESHEIDFLERFEARGERARWIRKDPGRRSTNDFVWLTRGETVCELKCTATKYSSIRGHIQKAVLSARDNHGVVKDVFVIDLGPYRLSEKLRRQLSRYNANVKDGRIRRLFVMSGDGAQLEEINLASAD